MIMDKEHAPDPSDLIQTERRKSQCECGSKLFFREGEEVHCAMWQCNKKWKAQRDEDKNLPTFAKLKEQFNGK